MGKPLMPTSWALTPDPGESAVVQLTFRRCALLGSGGDVLPVEQDGAVEARGIDRTKHEQAGDVIGGPGCFQLPAAVHRVQGAVGRGVHARGSRDPELLDDIAPVGHIEPAAPRTAATRP